MKMILQNSNLLASSIIVFLITILTGCDKSTEQLIFEYSKGDEATRTEVLEILISRIESEDYTIEIEAIEALGRIRDQRAIEPLIRYAESGNTKSTYLKQTMINFGRGSVVPLISVLNHQEDDMRQFAVEILGELGDVKATEPLIAFMAREDNNQVRLKIIRAIGNMDDPGATETLIEVISTARTVSERSTASYAIGKYGDESAISLLVLMANWAPALDSRMGALSSLGQLADLEDIPDILPTLKDWDMKELAYESLTQIKWEPLSEADQVHAWIATNNSSKILNNWDMVKEVILQDVISYKPTEVQYSLFAFISIGNREIISELVEVLNRKGTSVIAEAYLNSGVSELATAAEKWAIKHGYRIESTSEKASVTWGEMTK